MLRLGLTRVSPTHHRMDVVRSNGSRESAMLETRSALDHDFAHLALETEAGVSQGFFGLLDRGFSFAALSGKSGAPPGDAETRHVEAVVGTLTGFLRSDVESEAAAIVTRMRDFIAEVGEHPPAWLTEEVALRARERFRRLKGEWKATPFGATMHVQFGPE